MTKRYAPKMVQLSAPNRQGWLVDLYSMLVFGIAAARRLNRQREKAESKPIDTSGR